MDNLRMKGDTFPVKMFGLGQKVLSNLSWSGFWPILAKQETLAILHENETEKIYFFRKKNFKMADWKKLIFQNRQFSRFFRENFMLGLVGLNDAKPIDLAQPIWRWGCLKKALKQAKNVFFVFLGPFRAYVGQPQGHIGWAIWMGFASFNPTNPRTNPWNFREKILRIGDFGK